MVAGAANPEMPIISSSTPYKRSGVDAGARSNRRMNLPPPHEPKPSPAMKTESTMDTIGVVTPNFAMPRRSQITS